MGVSSSSMSDHVQRVMTSSSGDEMSVFADTISRSRAKNDDEASQQREAARKRAEKLVMLFESL